MSGFNAARSRAKRPCPLWVDAFQRDTQHLEADEVGAYFLILMAMWTRESCDFPDDDARLARVSRVSTRIWKSRIGQVLRPFFRSENGALISERLRREATYVERQVKQQSDRKASEKSDKSLENNDMDETVDYSTDVSTAVSFPTTQQPTKSSDANASDGEAVDFAKAIFENGVRFLCAHGQRESGARSLIGKWRKDHSDREIFDAFTAAKAEGVVEPAAWITARLGAPPTAFSPAFDLSKFEATR